MKFEQIGEASDHELLENIGEKEALLVEASDYLSDERKKEIARELNHLIFEIDWRNGQHEATL